jgi:probable HAF family extracellular repeat protein
MSNIRRCFWSAMAWLVLSPQALAAGYRFVQIDFPESDSTELTGINARGAIVGRYVDADGAPHGLFFENGEFTSIDVPGALFTLGARAINARGDIFGSYHDRQDVQHVFILSDGRFTRISHPDAIATNAGGINNAGDITGQWWNRRDESRGYIRRNGRFFNVLGPEGTGNVHVRMAQDNGRVLVGHFVSEMDGGSRGFIRHASGEYEVIENPELEVQCIGLRWINQRGDMVGAFARIDSPDACHPPFEEEHAFLLRNGEYTIIDFPGAPSTQPFAINDDGVIVGRFTDAAGRVHGFKATPRP